MDTNKFIWQPECHARFREIVEQEIFIDKVYEKFFEVEEGDVVFDVGASLGVFTYSILDKNPSHVFAFEPSFEQFKTLVLNTREGNVTNINKGISSTFGKLNPDYVFDVGDNKTYYSTTFMKVIKDYNIKKIDFLKTDCEGGEYDIFNTENLSWIKENVSKISGEWHLGKDFNEKFIIFRDTYLKVFPNFKVRSIGGHHNIEKTLWDDEFTNHFNQIMIYIDNR